MKRRKKLPAVTKRGIAALREQAEQILLSRCTSETGWFLASSAQNKGEGNYAVFFGRDSAWICLFLLEAIIAVRLIRANSSYQANIAVWLRHIKLTLEHTALQQGRVHNVETGEEPGKCAHEVRSEASHLAALNPPWPIEKSGLMRLYQSVDSTPLFLVALMRYFQVSGDESFINRMLPYARSAMHYLTGRADSNRDGLIDYTVSPNKKKGGLPVHNWTDNPNTTEGALHYPMAPVEAQGYAWLAFKLWESYLREAGEVKLSDRTRRSRWKLESSFVKFKRHTNHIRLAPFINGKGSSGRSVRSNMGHVLYSAMNPRLDKVEESVGLLLPPEAMGIAAELTGPLMFDPKAGIRTLSREDPDYDERQYQLGKQWTHDNAINFFGLLNYGHKEKALEVARAVFRALLHFGEPGMELYGHNAADGYFEHRHSGGNLANREQGWALAAVIAMAEWMELLSA